MTYEESRENEELRTRIRHTDDMLNSTTVVLELAAEALEHAGEYRMAGRCRERARLAVRHLDRTERAA